MSLRGNARYLSEQGQLEEDTFGPMVQTVDSLKYSYRFDDIQPNTNYTVQVGAETRTQRGRSARAFCRMATALPDRQALNVTVSRSLLEAADAWSLRLKLPRVSERKGAVCCYAVVVVKMLEGQVNRRSRNTKSIPKTWAGKCPVKFDLTG